MKTFGTVTDKEIQKIEKRFQVVFPDDYKKFLMNFNGCSDENYEFSEIYLKDIKKSINIDVLYGIDTGKTSCDIEYWTEKYYDDLIEDTIIIGDSLQQGFIVLICSGKNAGIYYYDDSYYFEESDDMGNVYWISGSFEKFWGKLAIKNNR